MPQSTAPMKSSSDEYQAGRLKLSVEVEKTEKLKREPPAEEPGEDLVHHAETEDDRRGGPDEPHCPARGNESGDDALLPRRRAFHNARNFVQPR